MKTQNTKILMVVLLVIFTALSTVSFAEEAETKEDPSKSLKHTTNKIAGIPLKSEQPSDNKLVDAGNKFLKSIKKAPKDKNKKQDPPKEKSEAAAE